MKWLKVSQRETRQSAFWPQNKALTITSSDTPKSKSQNNLNPYDLLITLLTGEKIWRFNWFSTILHNSGCFCHGWRKISEPIDWACFSFDRCVRRDARFKVWGLLWKTKNNGQPPWKLGVSSNMTRLNGLQKWLIDCKKGSQQSLVCKAVPECYSNASHLKLN